MLGHIVVIAYFVVRMGYNLCCNGYDTNLSVEWIGLGPRVSFIKSQGLKI
jgi:hypothetical protein